MGNSNSAIKRPNFFILGAPKCGTTSLAFWLGEHPNIFMSTPKETRYFDTDHVQPGRPRSIVEYERIFSSASQNHKAIGEASTSYLGSSVAVSNLLQYAPEALFIVCLRNPIEMVQSLHSQLLKMGTEREVSYERAWALQEARQRGENVPRSCHDKTALYYGQICMLGEQMKRLFQVASPERVLVIFLEKMKSDPGCEYRRVLDFLEVEDDGRQNFQVKNARAVPRFPYLSQLLRVVGHAKVRIGLNKGIGLGQLINRMNVRELKVKQNLSPGMGAALCDYFKEDIELLSNIMDRDLSHWLTKSGFQM